MPERYYTESPDSFEDDGKEQKLEFIRKDLEDIFSQGFSGDSQTEDLEDLTVKDVKEYIYDYLLDSGIIEVAFANTVDIVDTDEIVDLCDFLSTTLPNYPQEGKVQVHFLESSDFAATVSVIQTGLMGVSVKVEALEDSPKLLVKKWEEIIDNNSIKEKEKNKKDKFIDLKNKFGKNI